MSYARELAQVHSRLTRLSHLVHINSLNVLFRSMETEDDTALTGRIQKDERAPVSDIRARFVFPVIYSSVFSLNAR